MSKINTKMDETAIKLFNTIPAWFPFATRFCTFFTGFLFGIGVTLVFTR